MPKLTNLLYFMGMVDESYRIWAKQAAPYFKNLGAADDVAEKFALLYLIAYMSGLNPSITSIFRDPEYQDQLRARWDAGDRAGLRARPAENSKHSETSWLGSPASLAMDMPTDNDTYMADWAEKIDLKSGQAFRKPDPGHYYL